MNHSINVTCILSNEQLKRLQAVTEILKKNSKNEKWTEQMTLQPAIGTPHLIEIILVMLENYVAKHVKK